MNTYFELSCWTDINKSEAPGYRDRIASIILAKCDARALAKKYALVELVAVHTSIYDLNEVYGRELIASWADGKRII